MVFQSANDMRTDQKVCYTLSRCPHRLAAKDATLSRWISRVRIPLGAPFKSRSPLPPRWRAFCCACAGIRTRQGAELRKRASVSQRSTQGAKRRSEGGRRQPHADIPLGAPFKLSSPSPSRWRAFCCACAGIRTRQGAELRKRASVSQRSTQGAKRRSEGGRRQPHADIPLGAPFKLSSPLPPR